MLYKKFSYNKKFKSVLNMSNFIIILTHVSDVDKQYVVKSSSSIRKQLNVHQMIIYLQSFRLGLFTQ